MTAQVYIFEGRPPTHNADRFKHWTQRAETTKTYRLDAFIQAKNRPALQPPVEVHIQPVTATNTRADAGACFDVVKAIIDGIVDAGVLPDDGPDIIKVLHFHAPEKMGADRLLIEVTEITDG